MNHERILFAYLGAIRERDRKEIMDSLDEIAFANLNHGLSSQVDANVRYQAAVKRAVANLHPKDLSYLDDRIRAEAKKGGWR